jgi:hypothetical protein
MERAAWAYFNGQWQFGPEIEELRQQRAVGKLTRSEYKAGIVVIKGQILQRMVKERRITAADMINPGPPPLAKGTRKPYVGKKVSISKAVPAHWQAHRPKTLYKYNSEFHGGLPGLGKR